MKAKFLNCLFSLSIVLSQWAIAQNLVPNPSFEDFTACPEGSSKITYATPWTGPTNNDSDLFSSCSSVAGVPYNNSGFSYQQAKTDVSYAGFWAYNGINASYREYLQVRLTSVLPIGECYLIRFYTNPMEHLDYSVNNIALHLSDTAISTTGTLYVLNLEPHIIKSGNPIIKDTMNWTEVSGIYTAIGGEEYITIGNFKNDSETDTLNTNYGLYPGAYYYIDDVSVINISDLGGMPANAGPDVSVAPGDSIFIGQDISNLNCTWSVLGGGIIASNVSGLYVKPTVMTTYVVEQTLCGITTTDTVNVYLTNGLSENYKNSGMRVFPNPANSEVILYSSENNSNFEIQLIEISGKTLAVDKIILDEHQIKLNVAPLRKGIYFIQFTNNISHEKYLEKLLIQP